jgi:pyridoxine 5-phosphate synthase
MTPRRLRLGVNIDHVATIRNARGGRHPDPVRAALLAAAAGADGITAHLREDRRHISDADIERLTAEIALPLNLEMAATPEMLAIALRHRPHAACIVPEKRTEITTEGGLDAAGGYDHLARYVRDLAGASIRVSLFIDPDPAQLDAAKRLGAPVVELHTGAYCEAEGAARATELARLVAAAAHAEAIGLECHAGHGLSYETVGPVAAIPTLVELNIGHFLVGEAIFSGLDSAIRRMRAAMDKARA